MPRPPWVEGAPCGHVIALKRDVIMVLGAFQRHMIVTLGVCGQYVLCLLDDFAGPIGILHAVRTTMRHREVDVMTEVPQRPLKVAQLR